MNAAPSIFRGAKSEREAWAWLIVRAAVEPRVETFRVGTRSEDVSVARGQIAVSVRGLADEWGWTRYAVESFLSRLCDAGLIEKTKRTPVLVLSIKDYEKISPHKPKEQTHKAAVEPVKRPAAGTGAGMIRHPREVRLNSRVTSTDGFRRWLSGASMGDWCVYHEGQIGADRITDADLNERAALVMLLTDLEYVNASIARPPHADPEIFCYLATRTGRGWAPRAILAGQITANLFLALRAVRYRAADMSATRAIRDTLAVSDAAATAILNDLATHGLVAPEGYKSSWVLTDKGKGILP